MPLIGEPLWLWLTAVVLVGLCVGSFLNVVIYRLPRGESLIWGRSHCPRCGQALAWYELVPVVSYILLRGSCRHCRAAISPRYPLVELLTALLFAGLYLHLGITWALAKYLFLGAVLIAVTFIDLEFLLIPDHLVVAGLVGGVLLGLAARDVGLLSALLGAAVCSGVLLLVAVASGGGMGGGDIKLGAVTGLFLGWPLAPLGLFLGVLVSGLVAVFLLALHLRGRRDPIPFGPFIALGSLLALFWGKEILYWYLNLY